MTIAPTHRMASSNGSPPPAPPAPPAAPAGGGFNTVDPLRLLKKYKVWLTLVLMLGAIAGAAAHFVLKEVRPSYRAAAVFRVYPPRTDVTETSVSGDEEELAIFMATEAQIMVSADVLRRAMEDPRLSRLAPKWTQQFTIDGRYSPVDAAIELEKRIGARPMSGTAFVRLTMSYSDPAEVAALVGTVREAYLADLARRGAALTANETSALDMAIKESNDEIARYQAERNALAIEHSLDALDVRVSSVRSSLDMRASELVLVERQIMDAGTRLREMELQLQRPGGIEYADSMRQEVQMSSGIIQGLQGQIVSLETSRLAARERLGPDHRELRTIENHLQALNQKLEQEMQRLLRDRFEGTITLYREYMQSLRAQQADLLTQIEDLSAKLNELVVVQNDLQDLEMKIGMASQLLAEYEVRRKSIQTTVRLDVADRVILAERERVPERLAFPKLFIMIPAGIFVFGGLFAAGVVLFETVDQRVKSPADIAGLPMARVLGVVPHASEDPASVKSLETVYRDHPSGVMAECYRQTRALALKQMRQTGARSLAIIPAMPGSGGTTVAANLAQALAATDLKVLLIDANFRRPRQHAIFGLDEAPGLAEALGGARLDQTVRPSGYDGLDILTAGGADPRRQERLATDTMARLIAAASETYDYVIVDTAPIVVSGDAINMANKVDATILVTRAYSEKRGMIGRVLRDLREQPADTLGVIVNGVRAATGGYLRRNIIATHKYQNTSRKA